MASIQIPAGQADLEGLVLLAAGLEKLTGGGKVEVKQVVVIESENMPAIWALQDIFTKDYMKALPAGAEQPALPEPGKHQVLKADGYKELIQTTKPLRRTYKPRERKEQPAQKARPGLPGVPKVRSYLVTACAIPEYVGQKFAGNSVGKLISLGKFPPGTRFHHPAKGNLIVTNDHRLLTIAERQEGK